MFRRPRPLPATFTVWVYASTLRGVLMQTAVWNVEHVLNDLEGSLSVEEVLDQGTYMTCNSTQVAATLVSIGRCEPCVSVALATGVGYYCDGSGRAVLCPNNHYCPTPDEKVVCGRGHWCRPGFVAPQECSYARNCTGDGTGEDAIVAKIGTFVILVVCVCFFDCFIAVWRVLGNHMFPEGDVTDLDEETIDCGVGFAHGSPPVSIRFEGLGMTLKTSGAIVLKNLSGSFPEASLVALMGPSGGGKTTFMNALCGRASYGTITGSLYVNNKPCNMAQLSKVVGFVPQDDIMHPDLTVQQNILYNALLRLPAATVMRERHRVLEHAVHIVKVLRLDTVAHNLVGDPEKRGVSGGQRKRVNIGMELAAMPAVIFMDEPTSGLDGAAAIQLARCLDNLRQSGLTIVCVIHQPRWAVYSKFSHLLLLGAGGEMVYCGDATKIEAYLNSLFFVLPANENQADWMIDIVCGLSVRYKSRESQEVDTTFTAPDDLFRLWDERCRNKKHPWSDHEVRDLPALDDRRTANHFWQTWFFLTREALKFNRNDFLSTFVTYFWIGCGLGLLASSFFPSFSYADLPYHASGHGMTLVFIMGITISGRGVFAAERLQYMREFSSGIHSTSYFIAKNIFHVFQLVLYSFAFSSGLYFFMPLLEMSYVIFLSMVVLTGWYHSGLGMVLSTTITSSQTSLLMAIFCPLNFELIWGMTIDSAPGLAALTCGRWYFLELFVRELREYPEHIREIDSIKDELARFGLQPGDVDVYPGTGWMVMLGWGMCFRLVAWIAMLLLAHSEGNGCVSRIRFLILRIFTKLGLEHLCCKRGPRGTDVEDRPEFHRKPTHTL